MTEPQAPQPEPPNKPGRERPKITWRHRVIMWPIIWLVTFLMWTVRWTTRITVVRGGEQLDRAHADGGVMIPCGWHQRLFVSGIFLAEKLPRDMRAGFLISPSIEGEFIARVAMNHGTSAVRGSSSHRGGSQALASSLGAMASGVSPMMFGDGPRGPAGTFKRGAVLLAQRSGKPMMIIGCAASRYWQINSWDKTCIPKPFSHFTVAVDELWYVPENLGPEEIDALAVKVGERINAMTAIAEAAL